MMHLFHHRNHEKINDEERLAVFDCLQTLRPLNYPDGRYWVHLDSERTITVELGPHESSLLRLIDRIVEGVVRESRAALIELAGTEAPAELRSASFHALTVVRKDRWRHGAYMAQYRGGQRVRFLVGRWDAAVIEQFDRLIQALFMRNRGPFEASILSPSSSLPRLGHPHAA